MSLRLLLILVVLLSAPALADDMALFAVSWLFTGGPFAPYFASLWGLRASNRLKRRDKRTAKVLTVLAACIGYWIGADIMSSIKWSTAEIHGGAGMVYGPSLLLFGLFFGRLPSLVYSFNYFLFSSVRYLTELARPKAELEESHF